MSGQTAKEARAEIVEAMMGGGMIVVDFPFVCPDCGTICTEGSPCVSTFGLPSAIAITVDNREGQFTSDIIVACTNCPWAGEPRAWKWVTVTDEDKKRTEYWKVYRT